MSNTTEQVVEFLRETAEKIESGGATLCRCDYTDPVGWAQTHELQLEWWEE